MYHWDKLLSPLKSTCSPPLISDEPEDKDLTISIINYTSKEQYIIRQDEQVEPLDVGSYIFIFNTPKKTELSIIFKNNKLAFGIL